MSAKSDEDEATAVAALSARWQERWPACRPIGHELRDTAPSTWVRFHSLPESKRYAEDEDEYRVLLDRHNTVIGELVADSHDDALLVISCAWSDGPVPVPRHDDLARLAPSSVYWTSLLIDDHWTHLFAGTAAWRTGVLDGLLRLIADDQGAGVIVASADLAWLYHPYDGGADVIASSVQQRDRLKAAHRAWLSSHPRGL